MNKIIITLLDKKEISLFDSKEKKTIWKKELNRKILGTYKVGKYLFIYTYSNWGYSYTSLLHFESGDYYWMDKLLSNASNVLLYKNNIYFINKSFEIITLELESGEEVFKKKFPYKKWYTSIYPKLVVYDEKVIAYNKKNAVKINQSTNDLEDFIFRNHDLNKIESMYGVYNITVNSYVNHNTGGDAAMYGAIGAGGDGGGGGDAGGGGGDGGG
jgi:uncharacterized membrane protein YgcG